MGDPLSPGMTIMTTAWMEREWLTGLRAIDRVFFMGARYMDDIMLFFSRTPSWDADEFIKDFTASECYWNPLKLEESTPGQFLETFFEKEDSEITYRLKNANEEKHNVWRYHHYQSRLDYATKRATVLSALRKAFTMSSDSEQALIGIKAKCAEFLRLGYPQGILKYMCLRLSKEMPDSAWHYVRMTI